MPNYKCNRCQKEFGQKSNYDSHINKKFPCKINPPKTTDPPPKNHQKIISAEESNDSGKFRCNYCGGEFTRTDSLARHLNSRCKVKKDNDAKMEKLMERLIKIEESDKINKEKIAALEEENTKYKKIINNTQNNIGTQNNNNIINIKINAYGTENVSKITVNDYKKILGRGMNSVPALVEKLHFDKNVPENHNVYISNLRDEYVLMYDGKIWRLKNRDDALQQLYEDKSDILETKFEELLERLDEPTIKMFRRFLKIKDDGH